MLKSLEIDEIRNLYHTRIIKDFPRFERRPFRMMKTMHKNGKYKCLVLEEENRVLAYAAFIYDEEISSVLLDYLAVDEKCRGTGVGSRFMTSIQEYWNEKSGIIIECETPDTAKTENEMALRKRRIDFYIRNGAENTAVRWRLFGVHYTVLWLRAQQDYTQIDVAGDLKRLYSFSVPSALRPLSIRMMTRQTKA